MLTPKEIKAKPNFIERAREQAILRQISSNPEAAIVVVHGRRRVGKTELIEQTFAQRNILKFEGLEKQPKKKQIGAFLLQLSQYMEAAEVAQLGFKSWLETFIFLAKQIKSGKWTLFFDELQWMSNYRTELISDLKYAWDNHLRYNPHLILVLCGSSPSFLVQKVIQSKALHNRSLHTISVSQFSPLDTKYFMGKRRTLDEIFEGYLCLGGIPEYLKYLTQASSVLLGICNNSFKKDSFFLQEVDKIFSSSLGDSAFYREIVEHLSNVRFSSRQQIAHAVGLTDGGALTKLLVDLEESDFIEKYQPIGTEEAGKLYRFCVSDPYLQFYFKFIKPLKKQILTGSFDRDPYAALSRESYIKWLGFAFERWCRKYHHIVARVLGFASVKYQSSAIFYRSDKVGISPGYQIDLAFQRADKVMTVCEMKYRATLVTKLIISEFDKKLAQLGTCKGYSIERVLITGGTAEVEPKLRAYFDRVVTLSDLIEPLHWG